MTKTKTAAAPYYCESVFLYVNMSLETECRRVIGILNFGHWYLVLVIWDFKLTSIDPFLFHENQAFTVAHQLYPAQAGGSLDLGFLP